MSKNVRVATVGTGYFSQFHYESWRRMADVELVGVCNRTRDGAKAFAEKYQIPAVFTDFGKMLDSVKPDLVDIITPPVTHMDYVKAAVDRGIVASCQKPFTPSLEDAEVLVDYIGENDGTVIIHENFRFQPWYGKLKVLLDDGLLGTLYQVSFKLRPGDGQGADAYLARQPYFTTMERFLVHETAIHLVDVFRYLFGEVKSIYAELSKLNPAITGEDAGIILFTFENGVRGTFDGNRLVDHKARNPRLTMGEMVIEGENGTLTLNGDGEIHHRDHGSEIIKSIEYIWNNENFGGDCVYRLNRHIVEHILDGEPLMNTAADYLVNLQIEEAVYQSNIEKASIVF
jgi:predicted dehydrogenase